MRRPEPPKLSATFYLDGHLCGSANSSLNMAWPFVITAFVDVLAEKFIPPRCRAQILSRLQPRRSLTSP